MSLPMRPVTDSLSGRLNAYSLRCGFIGRSMIYPSCLARLGALDARDVRVPADWSECRTARSCGRCEASKMRDEELLKGHAIYFREREVPVEPVAGKRVWAMPSAPAKASPPAKSAEPGHWLDVRPAGYAEAISAPAIPDAPKAPPVAVLASESPLEAMRRRAAERRQAQTQPAP